MGKNESVQTVKLKDIKVPDIRVTSQWGADLEAEAERSMESKGILDPVQLRRVAGELVLVDGFHRLLFARKKELKTVTAIIREGNDSDVLIDNLITARQRGTSDPVQEGEVMKALNEDQGMSWDEVGRLSGLSKNYAKTLTNLVDLPDTVRALVSDGKLSVRGAVTIRRLKDVDLMVQVALDATNWDYTIDQIRERVREILEYVPPAVGEDGGAEDPTITRHPIAQCACCARPLYYQDGPDQDGAHVWLCLEDRKLVLELADHRARRAQEEFHESEP